MKLYYSDPYLKEIETKVTKIDGSRVYFEDTIFYPEGGGQSGDKGSFGKYNIIDTQKDGDQIAHIFESTEGLSVGTVGNLRLDWDHRYAFMKRHSAQHLLSATFFNLLSVGTVAVHLAKSYITIELNVKDVKEEDLFKVEESANEAVRNALKIEQRDLKREDAESLHMRRSIKVNDETVKVVFIENTDAVACGGVHVKNTSEIGEIALYSTENIRGHLRTVWKVDDAAIENRRHNASQIKEASVLLSAPEEDIITDLKVRLEELESLRREIRRLNEEGARKEAENIKESFRVYTTEYPLEEFRNVLTKNGSVSNILVLRVGSKKEFLCISEQEYFLALKNKLSLKGGGRNGIYQGSYSDDILAKAQEELDGFKGQNHSKPEN